MLHRCRAQGLQGWDSGCPERGKPGVTAILIITGFVWQASKQVRPVFYLSYHMGRAYYHLHFFQMRKLREEGEVT